MSLMRNGPFTLLCVRITRRHNRWNKDSDFRGGDIGGAGGA